MYANFSALQRAENSSRGEASIHAADPQKFQCSSASRKFLNVVSYHIPLSEVDFSALQRAENSSTVICSGFAVIAPHFSALQRAENSSTARHTSALCDLVISVLFSEPKIPQSLTSALVPQSGLYFSALQRAENSSRIAPRASRRQVAHFSALQRAENSSIVPARSHIRRVSRFQCSSASRKFLNSGLLPSADGA